MQANHVSRVAILICALLFLCLFPEPAIVDHDEPPILVTNTDDAGLGSLRQAILDANANPGKDEIEFAISGSGPHTIKPDSSLPTITDRVVIDGYSQAGAERNDNDEWEVNNAVLKIVLDGSSITGTSTGFHVTAGNSKIRGLVIHGFSTGILIEGEGDNKIEENFIGTDVTGTTVLGNTANGVEIKGIGADENKVDENVISGNSVNGVLIWMGAEENKVVRNFIGTGVTGTEALGNGGSGVSIEDASENKIGGESHDDGNLIANNKTHGVAIIGPSARKNRVQGNYIGTDLSGKMANGNMKDGVAIENASENLIGGKGDEEDDDDEDEGNLISGNGTNGIRIEGSGAHHNAVKANFIGTDADGELALGNGSNGVALLDSTTKNVIGGDRKRLRNLISGNVVDGVSIGGSGTVHNRIQGNLIGTDVTGTVALGNDNGITLGDLSKKNTVGGTAGGTGNLIAGNKNSGIFIDTDVDSNVVQGNYIGTDIAGTTDLGNDFSGIEIFGNTNTIGGSSSSASNVIAFNEIGVLVTTGIRNAFRWNSIFSNDKLGIDLSGDDVTANIRTVRSIPLKLVEDDRSVPTVLEVRGEVFIPNDEFERINEEREAKGEPQFANARNTTAGTLKSLDSAVAASR
ncbi:right-handed parallel beta-helix repeat-containing protein, partial [bacterium]|nr:right-handed parallel beta-helix repeat-containing protein [bacterium]